MNESIELINFYPQISHETLKNNITNGYASLSCSFLPLGNILLRVDQGYNKIYLWSENKNLYYVVARILSKSFNINL